VAGRTLQTEEDRVSLMVVGDDDQNIYAFDGASVRYIRQFETDYAARRYALIENYRSTKHIIHCANRVIERARERMKAGQAIRVNHARRDQPDGGEYAALDPLTEGRVHVLEVPRNPHQEVQVALDELQRLHALVATGAAGQWGRFAVIARRWEDLEPMAALCRLRGIPVRMQRDAGQVSLHTTREGNALATLLRGQCRNARRRRVLVRSGVLTRWFHRRFHTPPDGLIEHPYRAALAQFICDAESAAPGRELVVDDLIESLYDFGAIGKPTADARPNAPLVLMTAHRAKGLEFDHVLILDGGGWQGRGDDERRLFYVAMTRARKSLTLCEAIGGQHPFVRDLDGLVLRSRPTALPTEPSIAHRIWCADPEKIVLSWPGRFAPTAPIHRALAALDVGSPLALRPRSDGRAGWELTDASGVAVGRMSSKFQPPEGEIVAVRVAAMLVRHARDDEQGLQCQSWELVLPEIEYVPQ
jgi:ATP-dependent DNA helicase RecQ